jgi:hypothetical protein
MTWAISSRRASEQRRLRQTEVTLGDRRNMGWQALIGLAREIAAEAPHLFDEVRGVAIRAITRSQVFLGCDGLPFRPAINME